VILPCLDCGHPTEEAYCVRCRKNRRNREYYKKNKDKCSEYSKKHYAKHGKEKLAKRKEKYHSELEVSRKKARVLARKHRAKNREHLNKKHREWYAKNSERVKAETNAKYANDPITRDRIKERNKRNYQKGDRDEYNAKQRDYYRRDPTGVHRRQLLATIKRNPAHGLTKALHEFKRGRRDWDSLNRLYSERLALLHGKGDGGPTGERHSQDGPQCGGEGLSAGAHDQQPDEDQNRDDKNGTRDAGRKSD